MNQQTKLIMDFVERYRIAGGREEHFALKEALEAHLDGVFEKQEDQSELRDYFAARAMQGFAVKSEALWTGMARVAYEWADAMIAERGKNRAITEYYTDRATGAHAAKAP